MKEEQIPEKATKEQLIVGGQGHRTELDREQDVWFAVAELAKGRTYREIAQMISEKKGYHLAHQQVYKDIQEVLIEWKRENMQNIDAFIAREVARLEEIERRVLSDYEKFLTQINEDYNNALKCKELLDKTIEDIAKNGETYMQTIRNLEDMMDEAEGKHSRKKGGKAK